MSKKRSKDPADWHPNRDKAFNYEYVRAARLQHVIRFEKGFRHYIHWEERKDFVLIYLNTPMEDEYSENYMLHPKVRQWMSDTGIDREDWAYNDLHSVIQFRHKHHAMMFKLSFPDGIVR